MNVIHDIVHVVPCCDWRLISGRSSSSFSQINEFLAPPRIGFSESFLENELSTRFSVN